MTTRRSTTLAARIVAVVSLTGLLAALVAGCGDDGDGDGGGDGRPTVEEVAAALPDSGMDTKQADCLAQAFVDSDISDEGLRAIVEAGNVAEVQDLSAADQSAIQAAAGEAVACSIADELPGATDTEVPPQDDPSPSSPSTTTG